MLQVAVAGLPMGGKRRPHALAAFTCISPYTGAAVLHAGDRMRSTGVHEQAQRESSRDGRWSPRMAGARRRDAKEREGCRPKGMPHQS